MPQSQNEIAIEDSTGNARDDQTLESKPAAVILGENLVDLFVSEDSAIRAIPGGGPLNVARTISRLKGHSYLFSRLSWDVFGRKIRVGLQKDGVILGLPDEIQLPTPLAVVNQDQGKTTYGFHLDRTSAFQINTDEVSAFMDQCKRPIGAIYAGTLGLVVEPMASVAEVILSSAAEDTLVVIDPNCRPTAIADKDLYIARLTRL
ncbi:fructokinase, partial [mine drainage metagenome]